MQFHAAWQRFLDLLNGSLQGLPEGKDVAPDFHGQRNADGRLTVIKELRIAWVRIGAGHLGNIPQAEGPAIRLNRQAANLVYLFKHAGDAQIDIIRLRLDHARRRHGILALNGGGNKSGVNAELRHLGVFDFNKDFFLLYAKQVYLLHTGNA